MGERIRTDYEALFRVDTRLTFFLNRGGAEFEHMTAEQQQSVLRSYDVRQHIDIMPTAETLTLLRRHRLLFRAEALGVAVYTPLSDRGMRFPFAGSERLRFHAIAKSRSFGQVSAPISADQRKSHIYRFATDAANQDPEGHHLTKPLRGFRSASDYPAGAQIVNNAADPTRRLTAVQDVASGSPRRPEDWIETTALPPTLRRPFVDTVTAGDRARKDGVVYEALVDTPGDDETNPNKWRRLFAPGVQAASPADAVEVCGRFRTVSLGDARPAFVLAEVANRDGRIVHREEFRGSIEQPLRAVSVDMGDRVGGVYRLTLKDRAGRLLAHNGSSLSQADQTLYVDGDAIRANAFAVVEIGTGLSRLRVGRWQRRYSFADVSAAHSECGNILELHVPGAADKRSARSDWAGLHDGGRFRRQNRHQAGTKPRARLRQATTTEHRQVVAESNRANRYRC